MDISDTYLLQPDVEKTLESWVHKRTTAGFFLHGPPGVGKTTLV
jgi:replication-associated recombination protein RarA